MATNKKEEQAVEQQVVAVNPATVQALDFSEFGFSAEDLYDLTGLSNVGQGEIRIPYTVLHQKDTKDNKKGDIAFQDGTIIKPGERMENIAILAVQPVRVMFPTPFNPKNTYICRSIDGKVGHTDGKYAGQSCATCEFAKYPEGGGASPCRDQRLLLCSKEDGGMFHIQIGGLGIGTWKSFMSSQAFQWLPKVKNVFGALKLSMSVKNVDSDYGPFPTLDFQLNPHDPFHSKDRIRQNLESYKYYREFIEKHALDQSVNMSRVDMMGEGVETTGANNGLF